MRSAAPSWEERAQELAGLASWTYVPSTGELQSNAMVLQHMGRSPGLEPPTLDDWVALVHPDDRERLSRAFVDLLQDGREYVVEHRLVLPGGRLKYMRAVACAGRTDDGELLLHGVTQDVTDARLAGVQLRHERDRSHAVLESLDDGYLLLGNTVVLEANAAVERMTGLGRDSVVSRRVVDVLQPGDGDVDLPAVLEELVAVGGGRTGLDLRRADGSSFPAQLVATVLPAEDGDLVMLTVRDVTSERAYERMLLTRAATDPLTGVLNSRAFREALDRATRGPGSTPLSLALLDLDHFKQVNDTYGHAVGDAVLCEVAERLVAATDGVGVVARVGGEEFAVLLPGCDAAGAHGVVRTALEALRSTPFPDVGRVTASAGVAQLLDGMDDDQLYRLADALLYEAKTLGRDQVR